MSFDFNSNTLKAGAGAVSFSEGLRQHMLRVYNHMGAGLVVTGGIAYVVSQSQAMMQAIFGTPLQWVVMLAPLAFVLVMSFGVVRMSLAALTLTFYAYSAAMGLSLASIFMIYTGSSIAQTFFISASMFLAMSIYGYTTKADLTRFGSFLMMGVIGLIIASIVNIFVHSSGLSFVVSVLGVLIFTGLTAYDTQKIKEMYSETAGHVATGKMALMGALSLYLDFINIFLSMLRLMGDRR